MRPDEEKLWAIAAHLGPLVVGLILLPLVGIAWLVLMIVATVRVANNEDFRYPLILRLVS